VEQPEAKGQAVEGLVAQARDLWAHFPGGEVAEEELISFRTNARGYLMVLVPRTATQYWLEPGRAGRIRAMGDDRYELSVWAKGRRLARETVTEAELWMTRMPAPAQAG